MFDGELDELGFEAGIAQREALIEASASDVVDEVIVSSAQRVEVMDEELGLVGDLFDEALFAHDLHFLNEANHIGQSAAPSGVEDTVIAHGMSHVDDAVAELLAAGDGLRWMRQIKRVDVEEVASGAASGLHLVKGELNVVCMA